MSFVLTSRLFKDNDRLQKCANLNNFHVQNKKPVETGEHVELIHEALARLFPDRQVDRDEVKKGQYGPSTARVIQGIKNDNGILGPGQQIADGIVGIQTIRFLDQELKDRPPRPPRVEPIEPIFGLFHFLSNLPIVIKDGNLEKDQDLEDKPVNRTDTQTKAENAVKRFGGTITEKSCKEKLLQVIGQGGPDPKELATFFFSHTGPASKTSEPRGFAPGSSWSNEVAKDSGFKKNHQGLSEAMQKAMQEQADASTTKPINIEVSKLKDGNAPKVLDQFGLDVNFSPKKRPTSPPSAALIFGIGSTQGITATLTRFAGFSDGRFEGTLTYVIIDHFGIGDDDVSALEPGQAAMWLLQRKMVPAMSAGCQPYRIAITVEATFSGKLTPPTEKAKRQ